MIIESLDLENFRNYENLNLRLDKGINIFFGENAQGKTNILEAIYLCATTRSHKGSKDREMIRFENDEAHIRAAILRDERNYRIDIHLKKNRAKGIAINKIPIKRASDLFGILNMVFFSPEDLGIIKNSPSLRRRFLDMELCQLDRIYFHNLGKYNKTLAQRNRLLKEISSSPKLIDTLDVWDMQLITYGGEIIRRRREFINEIKDMVRDIHFKISGGRERLDLEYEPDTDDVDFEKKLKEKRERDLRLHSTSVGPHRDDMLFSIGGADIRKYGSQGQQRTSALSLKLSEIELVKKRINMSPILLLDDVLSELDKGRQGYLLEQIDRTQTLITCTGMDESVRNYLKADKTFRVVNGNVYEETI